MSRNLQVIYDMLCRKWAISSCEWWERKLMVSHEILSQRWSVVWWWRYTKCNWQGSEQISISWSKKHDARFSGIRSVIVLVGDKAEAKSHSAGVKWGFAPPSPTYISAPYFIWLCAINVYGILKNPINFPLKFQWYLVSCCVSTIVLFTISLAPFEGFSWWSDLLLICPVSWYN